jgi:hypothetical protein
MRPWDDLRRCGGGEGVQVGDMLFGWRQHPRQHTRTHGRLSIENLRKVKVRGGRGEARRGKGRGG